MDGSQTIGVGCGARAHSRVPGGCVQEVRGFHRSILPDPDGTADRVRGDPGEHPMVCGSTRDETGVITIHHY